MRQHNLSVTQLRSQICFWRRRGRQSIKQKDFCISMNMRNGKVIVSMTTAHLSAVILPEVLHENIKSFGMPFPRLRLVPLWTLIHYAVLLTVSEFLAALVGTYHCLSHLVSRTYGIPYTFIPQIYLHTQQLQIKVSFLVIRCF